MIFYEKAEEPVKYHIFGAVLGCFSSPEKAKKKFDLKVTEDLDDDDPWIAVVATKKAVTTETVAEFFKECTEDPDSKEVPYYFVLRKDDSGEEFVVFTDEFRLYQIADAKGKKAAIVAGLKKGLVKEQLDFK